MKKILFLGFIALTALTVTSCSNDEVMEAVPQKQAIEFGTYLGRDAQARATSVKESELKASQVGFGVYAFYSGENEYYYNGSTDFQANFMNNEQVKWNSTNSIWEYSPIKYWPNNEDDKLNFIAYYPYDENNAYTSGGALSSGKISFTVKETVKEQDDLLYNTAALNNLSKKALNENVTFNFSHALSRIGFEVAAAVEETTVGKPLADGTTITVNSVTLSNSFYNTGTLDLKHMAANEAKWENLGGQQGYVLNTTNANWVTNNNVLSGAQSYKKLNADDSYIMIIPQTRTFDITINYTVSTTDDNLIDDKIDVTNNITTTVNNITFVSGKSYTFKLALGMNSVDIAATVGGWEEAGSPNPTNVNLPINTTVTP